MGVRAGHVLGRYHVGQDVEVDLNGGICQEVPGLGIDGRLVHVDSSSPFTIDADDVGGDVDPARDLNICNDRVVMIASGDVISVAERRVQIDTYIAVAGHDDRIAGCRYRSCLNGDIGVVCQGDQVVDLDVDALSVIAGDLHDVVLHQVAAECDGRCRAIPGPRSDVRTQVDARDTVPGHLYLISCDPHITSGEDQVPMELLVHIDQVAYPCDRGLAAPVRGDDVVLDEPVHLGQVHGHDGADICYVWIRLKEVVDAVTIGISDLVADDLDVADNGQLGALLSIVSAAIVCDVDHI
ncbi:MAG: hypothetical protein A4E32_00089 [Methanomassiliicoccales archaeon PtaU1.Bin124]|nr:MAG: hypothetical protein A4E32_00089 [Methanomassiliicoccales archaeon PtaU1.Bin124]